MNCRFHHLHVLCSNLDETIDFLTGVLGAGDVERVKFGTADGAKLRLDGVPISLRAARPDEQPAPNPPGNHFGYDHIGVTVDDLDRAHADLTAQGYQFTVPPTDLGDIRMAFFQGPDHLTVELVQVK
jgi:catechol 2,3-dioxygenase-like lactoylglutathione lyase family enzyme